MIEITVNVILGIIPLVGGQKRQVVILNDDSTVSDLINKLVEMYGDRLKTRLFDEYNKNRVGMAMFLNGRNIFALDGLNTKLSRGDEFLIFPPVGGG